MIFFFPFWLIFHGFISQDGSSSSHISWARQAWLKIIPIQCSGQPSPWNQISRSVNPHTWGRGPVSATTGLAHSVHVGSAWRVHWTLTFSLLLQWLIWKPLPEKLRLPGTLCSFQTNNCLIKEVNDDNILKLWPGFVFEWVLVLTLFF